jgi:hypothetical protein
MILSKNVSAEEFRKEFGTRGKKFYDFVKNHTVTTSTVLDDLFFIHLCTGAMTAACHLKCRSDHILLGTLAGMT